MQLTDEEQQRLPEKRSELRQRCTQLRYHLSTAAGEIENQGGGDLAPDRAQHLSSLAGALHSTLDWFSDNYNDLRQIAHAVINGWPRHEIADWVLAGMPSRAQWDRKQALTAQAKLVG